MYILIDFHPVHQLLREKLFYFFAPAAHFFREQKLSRCLINSTSNAVSFSYWISLLLVLFTKTMEVPTKKKATSASKSAAADHPKYSEMIKQALTALKERGGSSRQAVLKYIMANFNVGRDEAFVNTHLKMALKAGVKNNSFKQSKGTGAAGSFKLGAVVAEKKKQQPKQKKVQEKKKSVTPKKDKPVKKTGAKVPAKSGEPAKKAPVKAKKSGGRSTPKSPKKVVKKAAATKKQAVPKAAPKAKPVSAKKPAVAPKAAAKKTQKGKQ